MTTHTLTDCPATDTTDTTPTAAAAGHRPGHRPDMRRAPALATDEATRGPASSWWSPPRRPVRAGRPCPRR